MTISEPTTMLTDYLITVICSWFGFRLLKDNWFEGSVARGLWGFGFLTIACAALTGGSFHGFRTHLSPTWLQALWNGTIFLIGLTAGTMLAGFYAAFPPRREPCVRWLLGGLAASIFAATLLVFRVGLAEHFNHNDLYHVIQLAAFYLFYRGASQLQDRHVYRARSK